MKEPSFAGKYGPWALITGSASGIGAEFARQIAARGVNLVLADIQAGMLRKCAAELRKQYPVEARTVTVDLSKPDFMRLIRPAVKDIEIGLLVNNAGYGSAGAFMRTEVKVMRDTIAVNCRAPMELSRELGPSMTDRGRGGMIFLSSSSALQGAPIIANYAGTKAYNLVLAEGLWDELRGSGVDVLALCPGATNTPAMAKSGARIDNVPGMPFMEPGAVVTEALEALGRRPGHVPGRMNRCAAFVMSRLMPRAAAVVMLGKNTRKLYPDR
jgi:uncharacterized protein